MIILLSDIDKVDGKMFAFLPKNMGRLLFIPSTISDRETTRKYAIAVAKLFEQYMPPLVYDIYDGDLRNSLNFEDHDLIFFMGGSVIEQNKLIKEIRLPANFKGVIIGQSAGAFNLCKDIYLTKRHEGTDKTIHLMGLGLVDVVIEVHFTVEEDVKDLLDAPFDVLCIKDSGALIFDGAKTHVIGDVLLLHEGQLSKIEAF